MRTTVGLQVKGQRSHLVCLNAALRVGISTVLARHVATWGIATGSGCGHNVHTPPCTRANLRHPTLSPQWGLPVATRVAAPPSSPLFSSHLPRETSSPPPSPLSSPLPSPLSPPSPRPHWSGRGTDGSVFRDVLTALCVARLFATQLS